MTNGFFITFEGGEGSGKSTQVKLLSEQLKSRNYKTLLTREPGGVNSAEAIRKIIVEGHKDTLLPMSELLLLFAARYEHVEKKIIPAINNGTVVICDRFIDSSIAYQGYGHGIDLKKIYELSKLTIGNFKPDLTIFLDIPVEEGILRSKNIKNEEQRFENMDLSFHKKLHNGFKIIASENSDRFIRVDATKSIEKVKEEILAITLNKISLQK